MCPIKMLLFVGVSYFCWCEIIILMLTLLALVGNGRTQSVFLTLHLITKYKNENTKYPSYFLF